MFAATTAGFWTATHTLIILNAVLAAGSLITAGAALSSIKGTKGLVGATQEQVKLVGSQVKIEQDQLDQQRAVQLAGVTPLIVDLPLGTKIVMPSQSGASALIDLGEIVWRKDFDGVFRISVPFRNVGTGPSFIHNVLFSPSAGLVVKGRTKSGVVPVDEHSYAFYSFNADSSYFSLAESWLAIGQMRVAIQYTDIGTNQRFQTDLDVKRNPVPTSEFEVFRVQIFRCDVQWLRENEPFVETGESK
jgi:hypothetical protein